MGAVKRWALVIFGTGATVIVPFASTARMPSALAARLPAVNCAALALQLAPGIHPPSPNFPFRPPADAPRTPFTVVVPLAPGLTPLQHPAGSPFAEIQGTPYVQTASAEFHATSSSDTVAAWYTQNMPSCGWRPNGSRDGNAGAFPHGISFARGTNQAVIVEVGFADQPDGSTDVAIAVQAVRYPSPLAVARIHGPFVRVRIALSRIGSNGGVGSTRTVRTIVTNRREIALLVKAIDDIKAAFTVPPVCPGGLRTSGPAWLTFVRADGTQIHAFEAGAGVCGGGLAVNGFRWLLDPGPVWALILRLTTKRG